MSVTRPEDANPDDGAASSADAVEADEVFSGIAWEDGREALRRVGAESLVNLGPIEAESVAVDFERPIEQGDGFLVVPVLIWHHFTYRRAGLRLTIDQVHDHMTGLYRALADHEGARWVAEQAADLRPDRGEMPGPGTASDGLSGDCDA